MGRRPEDWVADQREDYNEGVVSRRNERELHEAFIDLYLSRVCASGHDDYNKMLVSCYADAGFTMKKNGILYAAKQVLLRNWGEIEAELRKRLSGGAVIGIQTLIKLCQSAKTEAVQLKAAVELVNKGGFAETQKIQVSSVEDVSDEELQKQIQDAMRESGLKVVKA